MWGIGGGKGAKPKPIERPGKPKKYKHVERVSTDDLNNRLASFATKKIGG